MIKEIRVSNEDVILSDTGLSGLTMAEIEGLLLTTVVSSGYRCCKVLNEDMEALAKTKGIRIELVSGMWSIYEETRKHGEA